MCSGQQAGSDAMIPVEIHESSPRFQNFVAEESNEERRVNLDLLDEAREEERIKAEAVKRRVERQYSSKVKPRQFQIGLFCCRFILEPAPRETNMVKTPQDRTCKDLERIKSGSF